MNKKDEDFYEQLEKWRKLGGSDDDGQRDHQTTDKPSKPILAYPEPEPPKMPVYPTNVSGYPNHLARSALFSPIKKGSRKLWDNEKIASRDDCNIFFTENQLDMSDCDVFLQAVKIAQGRPAGDELMLNRAEFLRAIGRTDAQVNYVWLQKSFERLVVGTLKLESKRYIAMLNLISYYGLDKETGQFCIRLDPEILKLFSKKELS